MSNNELRISKKTLIIVSTLIVVFLFITISSYMISGKDNSNNSGSQTRDWGTDEFQEVTLRFVNYEYVLEPSVLKKDVPVRMTVDLDSVYGCMRDVVIKSFNVRKYVRPDDNVIEFMPDKTGTIGIACSMNMGRGQFTVVE